ncbi:MAG: hypothetical protein NTW50_03250 [Candidatus Berkelbacteria bacterium]|nr:hypothetical protein [Candidatus Berkelbacteria bacterium]
MSNIITPQGLPDKLILPSGTSAVSASSVLNSSFLTKYTPSLHDGKFTVDLLHALQNHLPLTLFQKIFLIVTVAIPVPFDWKLSFFNFLYSLSMPHSNIAIILGGIFVIGLIYLVWRFGVLKLFRKKEPLSFLELVFHSTTSKSAYSMEQFFSLLHSLAGQRGFWDKIVGSKKLYSLEIVASREQGIRYILAVPKNDSFVIEKGLLSFLPGLKINEIEEYLPDDLLLKEKKKQSWIVENIFFDFHRDRFRFLVRATVTKNTRPGDFDKVNLVGHDFFGNFFGNYDFYYFSHYFLKSILHRNLFPLVLFCW